MAIPSLDDLGDRLGIVLRDPDAIHQAFVHSSYFNENPTAAAGHNERLEFLGDAVIGLIVSRLLYERFPDEDEGLLTARRAALVNRDALASLGLSIGLDRYLLLGRGESEAGGATRPSVLAGAFEALAGAIFMSEGLDVSRDWLRRLFDAPLPGADEPEPPKSAKSRLAGMVAAGAPDQATLRAGEHDRPGSRPDLHRGSRAARRADRHRPRLQPPARGGAGGQRRAGQHGRPGDRGVSRLRELRLHGFKTFADPTRFVFEPGVNAVIGPNGSGKSNMADAVRWVLGEQSNRSLRTRRADDVIFAGSQQRKPQGMAEAILTLDNADGWLPIEFSEVSIGRRAYRSGESEYLINGARARLRDVVELLGEGRLGANELVVVGQGTVDSALSLRPEERRQLFEEAAGVKNLQVRKNEALARLGRARDNLTRVSDLIAELKPQVRRLGLQAQHAQEHDSLVTRARALVLEAHRRRESSERQALGDARRRAAAAEAALEEHRSAADANRRSIAQAEEAYWRADAAAREAAQRHAATREVLVRAESALDGATRRLDEAAAAIRAAEAELSVNDEGSSAQPTPGVDDALTRAVATAAAAEAARQAAAEALADLDLALMAAEERLAEARHRAGLRIADVARREEQSARTLARREQLEQELEEVRREAAEAQESLPSLRTAASTATEAAAATRTAHEAALAAIVEAQPTADAARRRASELAEKAGAMRGELDALQERAEGRGRLGSILTAAGWRALLDGIDAPDEAWPAVEAVVGGELEQALLWQDEELAGRLVEARGSARLLASGGPGAAAPSDAARVRCAGRHRRRPDVG